MVFIPPVMRGLTGGAGRVRVPGATLRAVVDNLDRQYPGMRDRLCAGGQIRAEIAVSVDGEIADLGLLEPVRESSEVHFLPPIGGGA